MFSICNGVTTTNTFRSTATALALLVSASAYAAPVPGQGSWQNTLQARDINGDGTVDAFYDTVLNVTWLADANAGAGSSFDNGRNATDGQMTWTNAKAWAASLNVLGTTGWRLPTMIDTGTSGCNFAHSGTDCGYNVQTISADGQTVYSEMAHLYYASLGNLAYCDITGDCSLGFASTAPDYMLSNTGGFRNLQAWAYWSGVAYAPFPSDVAWYFVTRYGNQFNVDQYIEFYALAVRPGDVTAAVPAPQVLGLVLVAIGAAVVAMRRRAQLALR